MRDRPPASSVDPIQFAIRGDRRAGASAARVVDADDLRLISDRAHVDDRPLAPAPRPGCRERCRRQAGASARPGAASGFVLRGQGELRAGLRVGDLLPARSWFRERACELNVRREEPRCSRACPRGGAPRSPRARSTTSTYATLAERLRPYIGDAGAALLHDAVADGKRRSCSRAAQGVLLDVDAGQLPLRHRPRTPALSVCRAVPERSPRRALIEHVIGDREGVLHARRRRPVHDRGPRPRPATALREVGRTSSAATTGRPRRCGWFDAVDEQATAVALERRSTRWPS